MIEAVVKAATKKGPPPPELELAWSARSWNALPEPGGLLDQPAGLLARMQVAINVWDAFSLWKSHKAGREREFKDNYPWAWEIFLKYRERN